MQKPLLIPVLLFLAACTENPEKTADSDSNNVEVTSSVHTNLDWKSYTPEIFEQAQAENKLVLLEVGANWCHWCHVMDEKTYSDPTVEEYLTSNFVLTREDQDARPDLSAAYIEWGWPAIIIQNAQGQDLKRLKGYQEKTKFLDILKDIKANPQVLSSNSEEKTPSVSASNNFLFQEFISRLDHKLGAFNWSNKYLHLPGLKHGLKYYSENDSLKKWTDKMVKNSYVLVDPEWGGIYQYSAKQNWKNPHYEKLLRNQSYGIEAYSRYVNTTGEKLALAKAKSIYNYCHEFLGNETPLFYNSQNADLISGQDSEEFYNLSSAERYKKGVPSIDQHIYLKENAMLAKSLIYLWSASNDEKYKNEALKMTDYILKNYKNQNGLFEREIGQEKIFSLEDNLTLLELLSHCAQISSEKNYLAEARELALNVISQFDSPDGLLSSVGELTIPAKTKDAKNIDAVILFDFLGYLTEEAKLNDFAQKLYEKIDKKALQKNVAYLPSLMLANDCLLEEPFHALYISNTAFEKKNPKLAAQYLLETVKNNKSSIIFEPLLLENMTEDEELMYGSALPGSVFICTSSYCSAPFKTPADLAQFLKAQ